jgi:hypothetical protein
LLKITGHASRRIPHHAQKPSSGSGVGSRASVVRNNRDRSPNDQDRERSVHGSSLLSTTGSRPVACTTGLHQPQQRSRVLGTDKTFLTPLNPRRPTTGAPASRWRQFPGQTRNRTTDQWSVVSHQRSVRRPHTPNKPTKPRYTRPETHQNLIYPDKEQHRPARLSRRPYEPDEPSDMIATALASSPISIELLASL